MTDAHGGVDRADHFVRGDQRTQPVREVNDFGSGDAGKQVLRAAREAGHLVRKDRAADEHVIVLGRKAIERDRHVLAQTPSGEIGDIARGNRPEMRVRRRVVPPVIEDVARHRRAR